LAGTPAGNYSRISIGPDDHVDVERHYYSVLHRFAKEQVEVRLTARTVQIFAKGQRSLTT
jgi:hypothetical protein